jgi:hypothetical protein
MAIVIEKYRFENWRTFGRRLARFIAVSLTAGLTLAVTLGMSYAALSHLRQARISEGTAYAFLALGFFVATIINNASALADKFPDLVVRESGITVRYLWREYEIPWDRVQWTVVKGLGEFGYLPKDSFLVVSSQLPFGYTMAAHRSRSVYWRVSERCFAVDSRSIEFDKFRSHLVRRSQMYVRKTWLDALQEKLQLRERTDKQ